MAASGRTKSVGDVHLNGRGSIGALLYLEAQQGTVSVTVPTSNAVGSYYLLACADDPGAVAKANETNNCRASTGKMQVGPAVGMFYYIPNKKGGGAVIYLER